MNMQLHPRHFCFHWLLRRMRRKCIFNTSSTCNLICYCREESIDNLDISQLPVFGAQDYLEWSVLLHPQHRMGSGHCRAGQGKLVCVPRKTGSASGYVLWEGYTFHFVKSPSPFLKVGKSRNGQSLLRL